MTKSNDKMLSVILVYVNALRKDRFYLAMCLVWDGELAWVYV